MAQLPQLYMRLTDLAALPAWLAALPPLPADLTLQTHTVGEEADWEALIADAFGTPYRYDPIMTTCLDYHPAHVFYLARGGRKLATAAALQKPAFPGEGWLHMVGVSPAAQGQGLAKYVVLAALFSFAARGYSAVMLSTDDHRLAAIKTYLNLGFAPYRNHESHPARWQAVLAQLGMADTER